MEANDFAALRLIVIDDVFSSRRVTVKLCSKLGFAEIAQAGSGMEALSALAAGQPFDLVLTDLNLGDMTALELLQQTYAVDPTKKTKYLVMTSDAEGEMIERLQAAGMSAFLLKPLTLETLQEKFEEVL